MTGLAAGEPDVRTFSTTVEAVRDDGIVLEETYFYAEGGGQPPDGGTIDGVAVTDVQRRDGHVVHELAGEPSVDPGDAVDAAVDDAFRTFCMRAHTASHLVYGAGRRLFEDLGYGGFDISATERSAGEGSFVDGKVRVDFSTPTDVDDETLLDLERRTNRAVWDSRQVSWEEVPREEALSRGEIAFNTKTEEGIDGETVRVVTIEDWDVAACGGTHVRNTIEVGPVTVLGRSNPGEGLTRIEFTVGVPAIRQRAADRERTGAVAASLDTGIEELPDAIDRLQEERDRLRAERDAYRDQLLSARIEELRDEVVAIDGTRWLVGALPGLDANELADRAGEIAGDGVDVAALVGEDGEYLAVGTTGDVDAGEVVESVTEEFGGGGGGGPTVAQGGGMNADPSDVVDFLRA